MLTKVRFFPTITRIRLCRAMCSFSRIGGVMSYISYFRGAPRDTCFPGISALASIHFVPRVVTHRGGRKQITYGDSFKSAYRSSELPACLKECILSALFVLFLEPYSSENGRESLETYPLGSADLRHEGWMRDLRGVVRVSHVDDEWRIVWSEEQEQVTVHAVCRHRDIYSEE